MQDPYQKMLLPLSYLNYFIFSGMSAAQRLVILPNYRSLVILEQWWWFSTSRLLPLRR